MMTLRQAAERTDLSATTLRRYIKSGRLRARLIPGRYGPEYVVGEDDLTAAGIRCFDPAADDDSDRGTEIEAAAPVTSERTVARAADTSPAVRIPQDAVPSSLYRELLTKHEHLLVKFGMLRVSGQQLYEVRQEAERRAEEAKSSNEKLQLIQDRHAREIGQLRSQLRRAELAIAEKDERVRELDRELRKLQMRMRNADTERSIDQRFASMSFDATAESLAGAEQPVVLKVEVDDRSGQVKPRESAKLREEDANETRETPIRLDQPRTTRPPGPRVSRRTRDH